MVTDFLRGKYLWDHVHEHGVSSHFAIFKPGCPVHSLILGDFFLVQLQQDTMIRLDMSEFMEKHTDPQPTGDVGIFGIVKPSDAKKEHGLINSSCLIPKLIAGVSKIWGPPAEHIGIDGLVDRYTWTFQVMFKSTV